MHVHIQINLIVLIGEFIISAHLELSPTLPNSFKRQSEAIIKMIMWHTRMDEKRYVQKTNKQLKVLSTIEKFVGGMYRLTFCLKR